MQKEARKKVVTQLKKTEGMLKKVISMIEKGDYCIDVLQQSLAVNGMVRSVNKAILENHLNSCFKHGMSSKSPKKHQQLIDEVMHIVNKCSI